MTSRPDDFDSRRDSIEADHDPEEINTPTRRHRLAASDAHELRNTRDRLERSSTEIVCLPSPYDSVREQRRYGTKECVQIAHTLPQVWFRYVHDVQPGSNSPGESHFAE